MLQATEAEIMHFILKAQFKAFLMAATNSMW